MLLETIQIHNGEIIAIDYHNKRFNEARKALWGIEDFCDLASVIHIPDECQEGIFRCRVVYAQTIESVGFSPYLFKDIKQVKAVEAPPIDYAFKWLDRQIFSDLLAANPAVDELIILQNGWVSDCTIACLAFFDGNQWFVPATPLLKGTKRQQLLDKGLITEKAIHFDDLQHYSHVCFINTFRDLSLSQSIPTTRILS